ncbi:hypothetical protein DFH08DRAFT_801688 [Mycena albidolilacea]|uniref:Uncharacterized protein n=1 Tax=Mycena albidolilacea TaxID=1033008 RepID=A0AAD7F179_9AGAR|nr:hypothetical protein DFH08DRAFT_801688 [Mycena albidolilacea]
MYSLIWADVKPLSLPRLTGPRKLDRREPVLGVVGESPYPFYDAFFCSWDTFHTVHPLLSILDPHEWAGINGTFAFSPPNACSLVNPVGHSCARGMDNNVGFLNPGLAEATATSTSCGTSVLPDSRKQLRLSPR